MAWLNQELRYRQRYVDLIVTERHPEQNLRAIESKAISGDARNSLVEAIRVFPRSLETPMFAPIQRGDAPNFETHPQRTRMPMYLRMRPSFYLRAFDCGRI